MNILIVQTAFLGDVILTIPLARATRTAMPDATVDVVTIPGASEILGGQPAIRETLVYDKRGVDSGIGGLLRMAGRLRLRAYDIAFVPHRSLRSALLVRLAGIPRRVGFDRSQGRWFLTDRITYDPDRHEILRNLSLLKGTGVTADPCDPPDIVPPDAVQRQVDVMLAGQFGGLLPPLVAIAPGTVWKTKQWLPERFAEVAGELGRDGYGVVLVGGPEDRQLCEAIAGGGGENIRSFAGKLSLLGSAELIRRCRLLITNDSAPLHIADAVGTPVLAVFGATIPEFGFGPFRTPGNVVQIHGLSCRPCGIHGGVRCPIGTFECMRGIPSGQVFEAAKEILAQTGVESGRI